MKKYRLLFFLLSFLPMTFRLNYLLATWKTSPLDRFDGIFWGTAFLLSLISVKKFRIWAKPSGDYLTAAIPLTAAILIMDAGLYVSITTLYLIGSILFLAGMACFLFGERIFTGTLPIWGLLILGCPSSSYWSGYWLQSIITGINIPGLWLKFLIGSGLIIWMLVYTRPPLMKSLLFPALGAMLLIIIIYQQRRPLYGESLGIDIRTDKFENWLGGTENLTEQETVFFKGSCVIKKNFFDENSVIYLLAIRLGKNVHSIHPTELCLKSGGRTILDNNEQLLNTKHGKLAVQEILADTGGKRYLIYTWYAGDEWSSGNFLAFRRAWKRSANWESFQLMTPIGDNPELARLRLLRFLNESLIPTRG